MPRFPLPGNSRRALALTGACLALAASPAAALAQSAGDEQYADPLAGQDQKDPGSGSQGNSGNSGGNSGQSAPTSNTQSSAPAPTAQSATTTPTPTATNQLPRTGTDVLAPALAGGAFLTTGVITLALLGPRVRRRRGEPTVLFDGTLPPLR